MANFRPKKIHLLALLYVHFGKNPFIYRDVKDHGLTQISDKTLLAWTRSNHLVKLKPEKVRYVCKKTTNTERKTYIYSFREKYKLSDIAVIQCKKYSL